MGSHLRFSLRRGEDDFLLNVLVVAKIESVTPLNAPSTPFSRSRGEGHVFASLHASAPPALLPPNF